MNVARLEVLIKYMRSLPKKAENHFSMRWWFDGAEARMKRNGFVRDKKDILRCGTTACALGWAATVPQFKKAGLQVYAVKTDGTATRVPTGGLDNTVRGRAFFDLTEEEFDNLFGGEVEVSTPEEWANHAESVIRAYTEISD